DARAARPPAPAAPRVRLSAVPDAVRSHARAGRLPALDRRRVRQVVHVGAMAGGRLLAAAARRSPGVAAAVRRQRAMTSVVVYVFRDARRRWCVLRAAYPGGRVTALC